LGVTQNSGNFPSRWQTAAFCRMTVLHAVVGQSLYYVLSGQEMAKSYDSPVTSFAYGGHEPQSGPIL
jgi:hypothetical protein